MIKRNIGRRNVGSWGYCYGHNTDTGVPWTFWLAWYPTYVDKIQERLFSPIAPWLCGDAREETW